VLTTFADLPADRPLVTICEKGPRAVVAASILQARGFDVRAVTDGGTADWLARTRISAASVARS